MKSKLLAALGGLALFALSCSKSSEDTMGPGPDPDPTPGNCDTANMKYAANIVPILSANCYSCHGEGSTSGSGGIQLEGYARIKPYAQNGTLIGVITHAAGFTPMPFGGGKLSDCNINKIRSWINNGIQDN